MTKKKTNNRITLEDLAGMVARGFESVHTDIAELKSDVAGLKDDVSDLKNEVSAINDRFVPWYAFDSLVRRVDIIEGKN